ncbi:MAG: UbiA family prenyltransferase [Steroidobacteraceae bacterium]|jgi:4-hydroxybenzoate polyprenyltransferase
MNDTSIPLCLGLDGTLTPVRTSDERLLIAAKHSAAAFLGSLAAFYRRAGSSRRLAPIDAQVDADTLPFRRELLDWLRTQRSAGRPLVLLVDGDRASAENVASHLNLFDEIATTEHYQGTPPERRRSALVARFGEHRFDYVGSEAADRIVWDAARRAIVVGDAGLGRSIDHNVEVEVTLPAPKASLRAWIKAIRLHQWSKNGLILVPALLAHVIFKPHVLLSGLLAFVAFSLCASSVYIINDLFDLSADRQHPRKRHRPFAAGLISARSGLRSALLLFIVAACIAISVGPRFVAVLAGYYALTWAYSLRLKRLPLLDVMMLAGLYTLRIIAGAAAMRVPLSFWLLAFSVFMFLSLGFVKRYAELDDALKVGTLTRHARGYVASDLPLIMSLGTASGYCAIVVMALYINSSDSLALYQHHKALWLICPLMLFWISRVWIVATRGAMHDDPVVFALHDRVSLLILVTLGVIVLVSV